MSFELERTDKLDGFTYCLDLCHIPEPVYVTVNHKLVDGEYVPFEIFINCFDKTQIEWTVPVARLISAIFREGIDWVFLIAELKDTFSYEIFHYKGKKYHSVSALIGEILEGHLFMLEELSREGI